MHIVREPVVEIVRLEESPRGTFGVLRINKRVACLTLEPPDRENERNISSIPAQQYACRRYDSARFGETFLVEGVPGRNGVLIHPGNEVGDTRGCVLLGASLHWAQERGIAQSRKAFSEFMEAMHGVDRFHLTVVERY